MGIELQEIETGEVKPKVSGLDPELIAFINKACHDAAASAVNTTGKLAAEMLTDTMNKVEKRLNAIEAPPRMIARIDIGNFQTQLGDDAVSEQTLAVIAEIVRNTRLGLNTMLVGPAGCGKTTMAALAAKVMNVPFGLISWTAGMSETPALFARWDGQKYIEALWSKMYREPGIFCHDEMDRADPNALCKINAGTANGHFYNEVLCETINRHRDFGVVATCNTVGRGGDAVYAGANALDGSSLDRFVKVMVDYDAAYERRICPNKGVYTLLKKARARLRELEAIEIISTRSFQQVYLTNAAGKPLQACIDSLTAGWNKDLITQVGLDAEKVAEVSGSENQTRDDASESTNDEIFRGRVHPKPAPKVDVQQDARLEQLKRKLAGGQ